MTATSRTEPQKSAFSSCFFLSGATASGKTALGALAAKTIGAEVVSLDSMAIYRGMDIGTAKPTLEERGGTPHHMFDVADPAREYSLVEYLKAAERSFRRLKDAASARFSSAGRPYI